MATHVVTLDDVVAAARQLSPRDRLRLIERLAADLAPSVPAEPPTRQSVAQGQATADEISSGDSAPPNRAPAQPTLAPSLYGLWKGLVPEMSAEEITELRREAWAGLGDREV